MKANPLDDLQTRVMFTLRFKALLAGLGLDAQDREWVAEVLISQLLPQLFEWPDQLSSTGDSE